MKFIETPIKDLLVIEPTLWKDDRGYFYESYSQQKFAEVGITDIFVQDNQSLSQRGTLRGLHAQNYPSAQGKLVRVITGSVLDVAVDIRKSSPTYGQHFSIELSANTHTMLWIPVGFLHGFITLENNTIFSYKVSALYNKTAEIGVIWNDSDLNIDWNIKTDDIILSAKDELLPKFKKFESPF